MSGDEPTTHATLVYESLVGDALAPGEEVLWEGRPRLIAPPRWRPVLALLSIVLITAAILSLAIQATHGDVPLTMLVTFVVPSLLIIVVINSSRAKAARRQDLKHAVYRITNQRILRTESRRGKVAAQTELAGVKFLTTVQGRSPAITIDAVRFEDIDDPRPVLLRVLDLWSKSNRRQRVRRTPVNTPPPTASSSVNTSDLPGEITFAAGEKVLWAGRPRVHDPIDGSWVLERVKVLAWLMIPTALLLTTLGFGPSWIAPPFWFAGAVGAFWLAAGLYKLTITPITQARRRARTVYVLTNIRAITHISGRKAITNSLLLDMIETTTIAAERNGVATLWLGHNAFDHLQMSDAAAAHTIALDAIRTAGTPAGEILKPHDPQIDASV